MTSLSQEQLEAIGILQEELAELIQALSKIRRSGTAFRPFGGEKTNLHIAQEETDDVLLLIDVTFRLLGTDLSHDRAHYRALKIEKLRRWSSLPERVLE